MTRAAQIAWTRALVEEAHAVDPIRVEDLLDAVGERLGRPVWGWDRVPTQLLHKLAAACLRISRLGGHHA